MDSEQTAIFSYTLLADCFYNRDGVFTARCGLRL